MYTLLQPERGQISQNQILKTYSFFSRTGIKKRFTRQSVAVKSQSINVTDILFECNVSKNQVQLAHLEAEALYWSFLQKSDTVLPKLNQLN